VTGATLSRRTILSGLAALPVAACGQKSKSQALPAPFDPPPLKSLAPFPFGCAVSVERLTDPAFSGLLTRNFSQLTAEWEMKMEYILQDDGGFRFDRPDQIAAFARDNRMRLFGHTLVWYAQDPAAFRPFDGRGPAFAGALRNYILAVVGRYRGQAVGWDVVNEPVAEQGDGLRDCLWSRNLGQVDYIRRAFDYAREADPEVPLLINDYNLESLPKKRTQFMRLVETLLKSGTPLGGVGTQSHIDVSLPAGAIGRSMRDLASFGLPIHVSELDISLNRGRGLLSSDEQLRARQARLAEEMAEAFAALPPAQRFAFTTWGLRDEDSWLRGPKENPTPPWDTPLLFDDEGRAKPVFSALAEGLTASAALRRPSA
jgi:endo-1,4-beta-xylanase